VFRVFSLVWDDDMKVAFGEQGYLAQLASQRNQERRNAAKGEITAVEGTAVKNTAVESTDDQNTAGQVTATSTSTITSSENTAGKNTVEMRSLASPENKEKEASAVADANCRAFVAERTLGELRHAVEQRILDVEQAADARVNAAMDAAEERVAAAEYVVATAENAAIEALTQAGKESDLREEMSQELQRARLGYAAAATTAATAQLDAEGLRQELDRGQELGRGQVRGRGGVDDMHGGRAPAQKHISRGDDGGGSGGGGGRGGGSRDGRSERSEITAARTRELVTAVATANRRRMAAEDEAEEHREQAETARAAATAAEERTRRAETAERTSRANADVLRAEIHGIEGVTLAGSRAETAAARRDLEDCLLGKAAALRENDAAAEEIDRLSRALTALQERDAAAAAGARAALAALDAAELRAMAVYKVAAAALDVNRRMCDAVDVLSILSHTWVGDEGRSAGAGAYPAMEVHRTNAPLPSFGWVEVAVDETWVASQRLVGAAWARGRDELLTMQRRALSLGDDLRRAELVTRNRTSEDEGLRVAEVSALHQRVVAAEALAAVAEAKVGTPDASGPCEKFKSKRLNFELIITLSKQMWITQFLYLWL